MSVVAVLVVDDDPIVLAACRRSLGMRFDVLATIDAGEALDLAERHRPTFAIVDLRIGSQSGLEVVRRLRSTSHDCQIALVSGFLSVETAVAGARAGANAVLVKPISPREILRRLERRDDGDPEITTPSLARVERDHIERVVADCHGNISEAARRLGIFRSSLQRKLRRYAPPS